MTTLDLHQPATRVWNVRDTVMITFFCALLLTVFSLWPVISLCVGVGMLLTRPNQVSLESNRDLWCAWWLIVGLLGALYVWTALHYMHELPWVPLLLLMLPYVGMIAGLAVVLLALGYLDSCPDYKYE